jgi:lipooligosaccharide transport system ATP-binding protein
VYGRYFGMSRGELGPRAEALLEFAQPTTGLDPRARHILCDRLFRLKEQGTTLVLTTH